MNKFHINVEGNVNPCKAKIRDCPFPSSDHYLNKEIAIKESERRLAKTNATVPSLRKLVPGPAQLDDNNANRSNNLAQTLAEDKYADEKIEPSLLRRFENYKTDTTITGHIDSILYDMRSSKRKAKALTALSNNPNTSEHDLMRIVALGSSENKEVLEQTKNEKLLKMALANEAYVDIRHSALRNPLSSTADLYTVSLLHSKNHYKKGWKAKLEKAGYSTDHLMYQGSIKDGPEHLKEALALKKMALTMMERNEGVKSAEDIENFTSKIINSSGYAKMSYLYHKNHKSAFRQIEVSSDVMNLALRTQYYSDRLAKTQEIIKTKRHKSGAYGIGGSIPLRPYSPSTTPSAAPAVKPTQADIAKLDKFKNTVSMATYEQSVELQDRWKKGIEDLPVDMQKEVLKKRFENTQDGLRGVVDLFKSTDTQGEIVKSGLNNFVNHVNNMREQEVKKGFIAVDNPEFMTPVGLIKVEEHVGNYDYGEKMTFRVNSEKFEMSKPMQSNKWETFIHVKENSGTELEKPEVKKGFWAKLFG